MRAASILGFIALIFVNYVPQAFAGSEAECEILKTDGSPRALYALCIAEARAGNENAAAQIAENAEKHQTAECPCWDKTYMENLTADMFGALCVLDSDGTTSDGAIFFNPSTLESVAFETGYLLGSEYPGTECVVGASGTVDLSGREGVVNSVPMSTTGSEDAVCAQILVTLIQEEWGDLASCN